MLALVLPLAGLCLFASQASADSEQCLKAHEAAQEHRLRGHYVEARADLLLCAQRDCPRLVSRDCTSWLSEVDMSLPTVVFAVDDSAGRNLIDVRITSGGKLLSERADGRALAIDPGVRELRFEAEGYEPNQQTVSIREAEKGRLLRVTLTPRAQAAQPPTTTAAAPEPTVDLRTQRLLRTSYAMGAVTVVGLYFGVFYAVAGKRRYDNLEETCGVDNSCSQSSIDEGKLRYVIADVGFAVAGAAALTGAFTYLFARRRADRAAQTPLVVGSDGKALYGAFRGQF